MLCFTLAGQRGLSGGCCLGSLCSLRNLCSLGLFGCYNSLCLLGSLSSLLEIIQK